MTSILTIIMIVFGVIGLSFAAYRGYKDGDKDE